MCNVLDFSQELGTQFGQLVSLSQYHHNNMQAARTYPAVIFPALKQENWNDSLAPKFQNAAGKWIEARLRELEHLSSLDIPCEATQGQIHEAIIPFLRNYGLAVMNHITMIFTPSLEDISTALPSAGPMEELLRRQQEMTEGELRRLSEKFRLCFAEYGLSKELLVRDGTLVPVDAPSANYFRFRMVCAILSHTMTELNNHSARDVMGMLPNGSQMPFYM